MRKSKVIIGKLAVSIFLLLATAGYAQQHPGDSGAMDTVYVNCTSPDFFDKDSIRVSFDLMFWTDATPSTNEVLVGWFWPLVMSSSNAGASARVIIDERADGPVYKGTAVGLANDWEAHFNSAYPTSGALPASVVYGAIQDLLPPASTGPPLYSGTHILAHILIIVKDTTTIWIDTSSIEVPVLPFVKSDATGYWPLWKQPTYCPVTPLACIYKPGDANGDGKVDLSDLIFIINHIMKGGPAPVFECQVDLNADKIVTLLDVYYGVLYLFKEGNPPIKSWACCL